MFGSSRRLLISKLIFVIRWVRRMHMMQDRMWGIAVSKLDNSSEESLSVTEAQLIELAYALLLFLLRFAV